MQTLRTIVRIFIITIALGLLIFLSISLFKLIPAGIEQLASATVSLGKKTSLEVATTTANNADDEQRKAEAAPVTEDGLNGLYDPKGDIVILDERTNSVSDSNTSKDYTNTYNTQTSASNKTTYTATTPKTKAKTYTYTTQYSSTGGTYYDPNEPIAERSPSGGKNLKVTFSSIGIIQGGQFIKTNTFKTTDTVSMHFTIINEEDTPTGTWSMRVEMPAALGADKVKILTNLDSIPGESSYTGEARFDGIDLSQGTPVIRVILDIYNQVSERNENDNVLAVELRNVTNAYYTNTTNVLNNTNCVTGTYINGYYTCYNSYYNYSSNYDSGYYNNNNYNNGTPNLYVDYFEIGRLVNGSFYAQTTFNYGEQVTVRAHVRNNGGYMNSSWLTRLNIYDANGYSRDLSNGAVSPVPTNGESIVTYTVDNLNRGNNKLTLYVDSSNNIQETNESDNSSQINIQVY